MRTPNRQHNERQEQEELGRLVWAVSTRNGLNLAAPTTADLRALGARAAAVIREGGSMADAGVRAAANLATGTLADEMAAGATALFGGGGDGTLAERYRRLHADEERTDVFNYQHRPIASAAGELAMAALTFKGTSGAASAAVSRLSSPAKGKVGERMSDGRTILSGDIPIKHNKTLKLNGGGSTRPDHQTARGQVVEAKLGPSARLSNRQRQAQAELGPRYRYDHWRFDDVGRVVGGVAVGAQQGFGRFANDLQEKLFDRRTRTK